MIICEGGVSVSLGILFVLFLLISIVPGFLASLILKGMCHFHHMRADIAFIFDLFIFIINLGGLYIIKNVTTVNSLITSVNSVRFAVKYGILSMIVGIVLAIITGIVFKLFFKHHHHYCICRDQDK